MAAASSAPRRVVLYGRTSLDKTEGRSVDGQLATLREWARRTGRTVVAELRDDGISASRFATGKARSAWVQVVDLITTGEVDELGVWEISRSSRDRAVWAALIAACIDARVNIAVDGKVHDPSDPDDGFMLDLQAAMAVRESVVISKRTTDGKRNSALIGRPAGSLPYGYRRVLDPLTGKAVAREVDPAQAPVVKEVAERLLKGDSAQAIARDLNARGVRTRRGSSWRGTNIAGWITNPAYAGLRVYRGEVLTDVTATWPPLLTRDEHDRLVALFADASRDRYRTTSATRHLGTGLFTCGREGCGGVMRVVAGGSVGRPDRYDCRTCHKVSRNQAPVDQLVEALLVARLSQPDVLTVLAEIADDTQAKAAAAEVDRLQGELRDLRAKVRAGLLSLDTLAYLESEWSKDLTKAERLARPKSLPAVVWDVAAPDDPTGVAARWEATTIVSKRAILAALFTVTILPAGSGHWVFDPDLITVAWRAKAV